MSSFTKLFVICINILVLLQLSISAPIHQMNSILKIEKHQKQAIIAYGSDVELECQFDQTITRCAWSRQGSLLEITERYSYVRGNGNATTDCNVYIKNFQQIDEGNWQCESMADSMTGSIKSTSVDLTAPKGDFNLPTPKILSHDEFELKHNPNARNERAIRAENFAYACVLEKRADAQLYWEVNNIKITDTVKESVLLESISYTAVLLRPNFKTTKQIDMTLKDGDVLKCKAKYVDIEIPELTTTMTISEESMTSSLEEALHSTSRNIIIALGVVIAVLLLLLLIFSAILIQRNSSTIIHYIKHGARPSDEQTNSTGISNAGYLKIPILDDKSQKNVPT